MPTLTTRPECSWLSRISPRCRWRPAPAGGRWPCPSVPVRARWQAWRSDPYRVAEGRSDQSSRRFTLMVDRLEPTTRYVSVEGPVSRTVRGTEDMLREMAERYLSPENASAYVEYATADFGEHLAIYLRPERWLSAELGPPRVPGPERPREPGGCQTLGNLRMSTRSPGGCASASGIRCPAATSTGRERDHLDPGAVPRRPGLVLKIRRLSTSTIARARQLFPVDIGMPVVDGSVLRVEAGRVRWGADRRVKVHAIVPRRFGSTRSLQGGSLL